MSKVFRTNFPNPWCLLISRVGRWPLKAVRQQIALYVKRPFATTNLVENCKKKLFFAKANPAQISLIKAAHKGPRHPITREILWQDAFCRNDKNQLQETCSKECICRNSGCVCGSALLLAQCTWLEPPGLDAQAVCALESRLASIIPRDGGMVPGHRSTLVA